MGRKTFCFAGAHERAGTELAFALAGAGRLFSPMRRPAERWHMAAYVFAGLSVYADMGKEREALLNSAVMCSFN